MTTYLMSIGEGMVASGRSEILAKLQTLLRVSSDTRLGKAMTTHVMKLDGVIFFSLYPMKILWKEIPGIAVVVTHEYKHFSKFINLKTVT